MHSHWQKKPGNLRPRDFLFQSASTMQPCMSLAGVSTSNTAQGQRDLWKDGLQSAPTFFRRGAPLAFYPNNLKTPFPVPPGLFSTLDPDVLEANVLAAWIYVTSLAGTVRWTYVMQQPPWRTHTAVLVNGDWQPIRVGIVAKDIRSDLLPQKSFSRNWISETQAGLE